MCGGRANRTWVSHFPSFSPFACAFKIVENFQLTEDEDFEVEESEDTLSILDRYINDSDTELDKVRIQNVMRSTYQEACELI